MQKLRSALLISIVLGLSLAAAFTEPACARAGRAKSEPTYQRPDKKLLEQMIGDWDVDYAIYDEHGGVRHNLGTASFRWILDGAAIQEIWTSDYHGRKAEPYGTTLEFYDAKRQSWTAVWIYPDQSMYYSVGGGEVDGRIVLTGNDQQGVLQRWSNQDFQSDSFVGRFEISKDGGKTWRLVGVNHMKRHSAG